MNGELIRLRAVEPEDVDLIFIWENDETLWRYGAVKGPISRHQLWNYAQNYDADPMKNGEIRFVVEDINTGEAVGCIDLTEIDSYNCRAQVGIFISKLHRNRGLAQDALSLLNDYACKILGLHQVWAVIGRENTSSISLFEKSGFKSCGCLRSWIKIRTSYEDALIYQKFL